MTGYSRILVAIREEEAKVPTFVPYFVRSALQRPGSTFVSCAGKARRLLNWLS